MKLTLWYSRWCLINDLNPVIARKERPLKHKFIKSCWQTAEVWCEEDYCSVKYHHLWLPKMTKTEFISFLNGSVFLIEYLTLVRSYISNNIILLLNQELVPDVIEELILNVLFFMIVTGVIIRNKVGKQLKCKFCITEAVSVYCRWLIE